MEISPELEREISHEEGREEGLFLTYSNIHVVPQAFVALLVCRRLKSPVSKKDLSFQFNELSDCTIQSRRGETRNTPTIIRASRSNTAVK